MLQQSLPARDAAAFGHDEVGTKDWLHGNGWPADDIAGIGGAQPRRDRVVSLPTRSRDASTRRGTIYRAPTKISQTGNYREQESAATSHESLLTSHFSRLKDIFGDHLYIEVQHLSPGDGRTLREAEHIGRELGVPLVATNNVHFLRPEEHLHHRAVNAIRTGGLLTTVASPEIGAPGKPEIPTGEAWFTP